MECILRYTILQISDFCELQFERCGTICSWCAFHSTENVCTKFQEKREQGAGWANVNSKQYQRESVDEGSVAQSSDTTEGSYYDITAFAYVKMTHSFSYFICSKFMFTNICDCL